MPISGTSTFDLDIAESVEEAFERAGLELRSGYDMKTARRSINLLSLEWANRQVNLWTVDSQTLTLEVGTATYNLPVDTIDVLDVVLRTGSDTSPSDIALTRTGMHTYASIPNKNTLGRPVQVWVNRQTAPQMVLWPVPDSAQNYQIVYWRMRRIEDAGSNGDNTMDIPVRFLPAFVAGLAYHIAVKRPEAFDRLPMLKAMYDEAWLQAQQEDRERVPQRIVPMAGRRV